jgi:hypothetical protein
LKKVDKKSHGIGPIVLLTDFGHADPFAGILKGVIAAINPGVAIIDLTHGIEPQNIFQAAFLLYTSYSYFPVNSIFCVVVDPGVGSDRKAVCIQTERYIFVGPDNGVLWPAAVSDRIRKIIHLNNPDYFLDQVSNTFHGRDVFAPVCAHLSTGRIDMELLGPAVQDCVRLEIPQVTKQGDDYELTILHIDRFGNIALNLTGEQFKSIAGESGFCLTLNNQQVTHRFDTYSKAEPDQLFFICASSGGMEVSIQNKSAARHLGVNIMDKALLKVAGKNI